MSERSYISRWQLMGLRERPVYKMAVSARCFPIFWRRWRGRNSSVRNTTDNMTLLIIGGAGSAAPAVDGMAQTGLA